MHLAFCKRISLFLSWKSLYIYTHTSETMLALNVSLIFHISSAVQPKLSKSYGQIGIFVATGFLQVAESRL